MATVTINGFMQTKPAHEWETGEHINNGNRFSFSSFEDMAEYGYVCAGPVSIVFAVPEGFDPTAGQIAALEKQKAKLAAEFSEAVGKINAQLAKLQAISYEPAEVPTQLTVEMSE